MHHVVCEGTSYSSDTVSFICLGVYMSSVRTTGMEGATSLLVSLWVLVWFLDCNLVTLSLSFLQLYIFTNYYYVLLALPGNHLWSTLKGIAELWHDTQAFGLFLHSSWFCGLNAQHKGALVCPLLMPIAVSSTLWLKLHSCWRSSCALCKGR